jgi:AraC-like DNA-binding protein
MANVLSIARLTLRKRAFDRNLLSEQLGRDNPFAKEIAQALFDIGVQIMAIICRKSYHCEASRKPTAGDKHELILNLQGHVQLETERGIHTIRPGQIAYIPPGERMLERGKKGDVCEFLYFLIEDSEHWKPLKASGPCVEDYDNAGLMYMLARRLLDAHRKRHGLSLAYARSEARMLLTLLERFRHRSDSDDPQAIAVRTLARQISAAPGENWTLASMAGSIAVSPRTLARLFATEFNLTPGEWIIQRRMEHAMELLSNTTASIKQIAETCGYESVYSFMRLFRNRVGVTAKQFRERHRDLLDLDAALQ